MLTARYKRSSYTKTEIYLILKSYNPYPIINDAILPF